MPKHRIDLRDATLAQIKDKEWLVHNGIGGYASASICGMNTRRYHGLLIASLNPPTERQLFLSRLEERLILENKAIDLSTNQYPDKIFPKGYVHLKNFKRNPIPQFCFEFEEYSLKKSVFMRYGSNTSLISYENDSKEPFELHIRLQLSYRNHHALFRESSTYDFQRKEIEDYHHFYPLSKEEGLYFRASKGVFIEDRSWNKNLRYHREEMRGQEFEEDSFSPGYAVIHLAPADKVWLIFSLDEEQMKLDPALCLKEEIKRQRKLAQPFPKQTFLQDLTKAGDQFLVDRSSTQAKSILAGYHWFTDWGRDTMIAMRGLTIATGQKNVSRQIFQTFFKYLDQGMLPNRFFDEGEKAEYNTVDATLWLFVALYEYAQKFEDWAYIASIMPQLESILSAYSRGTRYNIHTTEEGFVFAGNPQSQLTWMDVRIQGHTVTPRWGCPVEINALWYNALKIFASFKEEVRYLSTDYQHYVKKLEKNFLPFFLNEKGYLHDVILPGKWADDNLRPNQLYAMSLPFPLLDRQTGRTILSKVKKALYTPLGIRTLSPEHKDFKKTYAGGPWERDTAYHQGTVWPFLLGAYFDAYLWVENYSLKAKKEVEEELKVIQEHFYQEGCIAGISEVFDGLNPKADLGKGSAHQAWSVSVLIELMVKHKLYTVS